MATLTNKTDEIAALETLREDLAKYEKSLIEKKDSPEKVKQSIKIKIADIRKQIREGKTTDREVTAKQLADSLLRSRKKFLEMSKKDFNGVLRQLAKKPEYAFLKGMTRQQVIDDIQRKAKPVGWRFKGRENFKTPTPQQVRRGRANGMVYYENRANRADVSQTKQLAKGGSTYQGGGEMMSINPKNFTLNEIEDLVPDIRITSITKGTQFDKVGTMENIYPKSQSSIAKWRNTNLTISDYGIIDVSKGSENLYSDMIVYLADDRNDEQAYTIQLFSKDNVRGMKNLISTFIQKMAKGGGVKGENLPFCIYVTNLNNPNANSELVAKVKAKGDAFLITSELNKSLHRDTPLVYTMKEKKYEDGGNLEPMDEDDLPVVRYYFEDDAYEYEDGGEVDVDDLNIPVHYTMFEDEMYEYAKGGGVGDFFYDTRKDKTFQVISEDGNKIGIRYMGKDKKPIGQVETITKDEFEYMVQMGSWGKYKQEYAKGGYVSKGEMVWNKLSQSKRMEFLYTHFTPQITPRSQEILVGKNWNFLPKNVKIKFEAVYANEDY